jgi:glutamate-ammonia-ligase adenylyltransferase
VDLQNLAFREREEANLQKEMHSMRLRIQEERCAFAQSPTQMDLKCGPGGILDIEFATQFLQIKNKGPHEGHTRRALTQLQKEKILAPEKAQVLMGAYDQYRQLANRLCLVCNRTIEQVQVGMPRLDEIARTMALDEARGLLELLTEVGQNVRKIYLDILGISE